MKTIILKNAETGEEIARLKAARLDRIFDLVKILNMYQSKEDILRLGYTCEVLDVGIRSYRTRGNIMSNDPDIISAANKYHTDRFSEHANVLVYKDGKKQDTPLRLYVTVYPQGYLLNVGKLAYNVFGSLSQMYLKGIGKRNIISHSSASAHVFPNVSALAKYILKHRTSLEYAVKNHGYHLQVEPSCELFEAEEISEKEKEKLKDLKKLLNEINSLEEEIPAGEELTGVASFDEMKAEAISRLKKFRAADVMIKRFQEKDRLCMSVAGSIILYDLDDKAEAAVKEVKEDGKIPYAVVRNHFSFGETYTVLYVNPDKSDWNRERPDEEWYYIAYAYNVDHPLCSEYGEVQIVPADGLLVRMV